MKHITFLGECMLEEHQDGAFRFGGDTLNSALYLSRIADKSQLKVIYASAIGSDHDSHLLRSEWQKEGIDTSMVTELMDRELGRYSIQTNAAGERKFSFQRDKSAARFYFKSNPGAFFRFLEGSADQYIYLSGISLAIISIKDRALLFEKLAEFKANGGKVIFDNNYRPILWKSSEVEETYHRIMALADIAFLTDEDEYAIYPDCSSLADIIERVSPLNISEVVIKQGNKPCIIIAGENQFQVPAQLISSDKVIDTTAAGDSFSAGYLVKRLLGHDIEQAAHYAHRLAGTVIQYSGAIIAKSAMVEFI